ncbi:MAG TPA: hypothetical protein VE954_19450 [Oligoflexus sp.]|uniref:hypothetical protein n=1 Tax=Oligoflexus sp. TaxID=1971216 RepID=UPI002D4E15A7|nr:hypothetical protein [Oligoflexus sp.]HYX35278.1 hypothetical protein [Oligoflexus sp.]
MRHITNSRYWVIHDGDHLATGYTRGQMRRGLSKSSQVPFLKLSGSCIWLPLYQKENI